jgi:ElaA protein
VITWTLAPFANLSPHALYAILHLRTEVFVMEQQCAFQDMDYSDQQAWHLQGHDAAGALVAYSRLFSPGIKYAEASIGRVMSRMAERRTGVGKLLMAESIARCAALFGDATPIRIGAQARLERFYQGFGFVTASEPYIEDGIPHIEMVREMVPEVERA